MEMWEMSATEMLKHLHSGALSCEEIVKGCLERIQTFEPGVLAWTFLDPGYALAQARSADRQRATGAGVGPLHGLPVGVKDIFDTFDMPTEHGTVLHSGRCPTEDATAVSLLRGAGAVIMGKTVTTELAVYYPGKTRNPHNPDYTPGGSSSGSAAAVAARMVPVSLGTQTNGSVIRPASYCGVFGFKPSHGTISRHGVLQQSRLLDQVGVFANTLEDAALIAQELMVHDVNDPSMRPCERPALVSMLNRAAEDSPLRLAFAKTPVWDEAEDDTRTEFAGLVDKLHDCIGEIELPPVFDGAVGAHRTIMLADFASSFSDEYGRGAEQLSDVLRGMIEEGLTVKAVDYNRAVEMRPLLNNALDEVFERFDAIVAPATTSEAPCGLETTGSPIFNTIWTLCGVPAISLPLLRGRNGLPMGVQLVGKKGHDARLLRTAKRLCAKAGFSPEA